MQDTLAWRHDCWSENVNKHNCDMNSYQYCISWAKFMFLLSFYVCTLRLIHSIHSSWNHINYFELPCLGLATSAKEGIVIFNYFFLSSNIVNISAINLHFHVSIIWFVVSGSYCFSFWSNNKIITCIHVILFSFVFNIKIIIKWFNYLNYLFVNTIILFTFSCVNYLIFLLYFWILAQLVFICLLRIMHLIFYASTKRFAAYFWDCVVKRLSRRPVLDKIHTRLGEVKLTPNTWHACSMPHTHIRSTKRISLAIVLDWILIFINDPHFLIFVRAIPKDISFWCAWIDGNRKREKVPFSGCSHKRVERQIAWNLTFDECQTLTVFGVWG